jgi:hypothetical protein
VWIDFRRRVWDLKRCFSFDKSVAITLLVDGVPFGIGYAIFERARLAADHARRLFGTGW